MMYAHVNPLPLILFPTSNSFFGNNNYTAVLYNPLICEEREAGRKGMWCNQWEIYNLNNLESLGQVLKFLLKADPIHVQ